MASAGAVSAATVAYLTADAPVPPECGKSASSCLDSLVPGSSSGESTNMLVDAPVDTLGAQDIIAVDDNARSCAEAAASLPAGLVPTRLAPKGDDEP